MVPPDVHIWRHYNGGIELVNEQGSLGSLVEVLAVD